ncbi:MAG TPA: hypothetical protein VJU18_02695 [Vicinamibacteria bacterium]|nr:hypothetical protein [Vicinamibacteria bacterium]
MRRGGRAPRPPAKGPAVGVPRAHQDLDAALRSLVARGSFEAAARLLAERNRFDEAAELFGRAALHYDAAQAHLRSGDRSRALDAFLRVLPAERRYREACRRAVVLATDLSVLTIVLDHFLAHFIKTGPLEAEEHETFFQIGHHYRRHGRLPAAREALLKLLQANPQHRDGRALLAEVEGVERAERKDAQGIIEEEARFRGASGRGRDRKQTPDGAFGDEPGE